jgi:3',5'-cyclic AMP phosphodiesterase CpdA
MSTLLQLSDPHFGTEQPAAAAALQRCVRAQAPTVAVWSGDITQRARAAQFAAARRFADALAVPATLVIPGNHDIPLFNVAARTLNPYAGFRRAFGDELEPVYAARDLLLIGLNTTRPWRHKNGEVSRAQIERTAARLQAATPEQLRVVVVHQPVCVLLQSDRRNLLRGHAEAVRRWSAAGVDLILGGHIHLPYVCPLALPGIEPPFAWAVQAGTAVSRRVRGGISNSVNFIRHDAAGLKCRVERWDFIAAADEFRCAETTVVPLRRAPH